MLRPSAFILRRERVAGQSPRTVNKARDRTFFDLGPVAVYSCDAAGVIQEFNRRAVELWGCERVSGVNGTGLIGPSRLDSPIRPVTAGSGAQAEHIALALPR